VVVLRDGRVIGELDRAAIAPDAMIRLMIGRDLKSLYIAPAAPPGDILLDIADLRTTTYPDRAVSLSVRAGEILGLAGLVGSGRTELARAVFGVDAPLAGAVRLAGQALKIALPRNAIDRGIYLVPEDRKRSSLLLEFTVAENISLPDLWRHARAAIIQTASETANAERQRRRLNIKTPSVANEVGVLSGGNQQKVVLAKWLSMQPRVIIFDEPTRGIDVGAKNEIYELMRGLADSGVAILMISSDMEEVIGVSDRVAVMCEGAISGFLERGHLSEQNILQLAVGNRLQPVSLGLDA
jgi:ribose transport system ATP-binding protein